MRLLPDTNVLVYETIEDSMHHDEACGLIDNASEIYLPSIVIHEYYWVMTKLGVNPGIVLLKIAEYLQDLRTYYFAESLRVYKKAFRMLLEDEKGYRDINDYIILAVALEEKITLGTYDQGLKRIATERGVKVTP